MSAYVLTINDKGQGTVYRFRSKQAATDFKRNAADLNDYGGSWVFSTPTDVAELGQEILKVVYRALTDEPGTPIALSRSPEKMVVAVWNRVRAQAIARTGRPKNPKSKIGKLRELLLYRRRLTVEQVMSVTGFDRMNLGVALSTLKDPAKSSTVILSRVVRTAGSPDEYIVVERIIPGGRKNVAKR
jgi:hypothetical protein